MKQQLLVTGAAGFIGSAFVRHALEKGYQLVILDLLTYAGHIENIEELLDQKKCTFVQGDICDSQLVDSLFAKYQFDGVLNFAAESHVDNSISGPKVFIETNIMGTFNLLENSRKHWSNYEPTKKQNFRFLHVSTDEVFGELGETGFFSEKTAYSPNSPYSASKAASDHLVRAWHHTYKLPTVTTNCSNNYGPRQYPEKLIPRMIECALSGQKLPVYGAGKNIRDWIHVEDHVAGILLAFEKGQPGESYCFGGNSERTNIDVVQKICQTLDGLRPLENGKKYAQQIAFVEDRAGHDFRYAIDDSYAKNQLGYIRKYSNFEDGLKHTIDWYLNNQAWCLKVLSKNTK